MGRHWIVKVYVRAAGVKADGEPFVRLTAEVEDAEGVALMLRKTAEHVLARDAEASS